MRVGVVVEQALAPVPGGIGRYARQLAQAVAATAGPDDTVSGWCAWHRDTSVARVDGVAGPRRLPVPRRALSLAWARGMPPTPWGCDVLHAPSLLFPPRRRGPLVVTIHDTVPWTHPETLTPHGARWHRQMARRAVDGATIATVTEVVAAELPAFLPGLDPGRIRVLGAGVTPAVAVDPGPERVAAVRARLGLPDRFVLAVATLEPRKGLDVLIDALGRLGSGALPLVVAGQPGWGSVNLADLAASAGLEQVRALGWIPDADLAAVLRAATVLVAPSRSEGFGLPVAEAMAAGTPVLVSAAPALVEVVGDAGVIVPVDDADALAGALAKLRDDADLRAELSRRGTARAARYTWPAVAERAWALYRELAD